jgi:hypothetical protein
VKDHTHEWNIFTLSFIDWKVLLLFVVINYFLLIACIYSEIEFIRPSDGVKIERETITFTKDGKSHTIFINKMINSGITRMFIFLIFVFIYSILLVKCYAFAQMMTLILVWEIFFFYCNDFIFLLFNNLMRYWYCIWIETGGPQGLLVRQSYLFLLFFTLYLIVLFYYYSNISYKGV